MPKVYTMACLERDTAADSGINDQLIKLQSTNS